MAMIQRERLFMPLGFGVAAYTTSRTEPCEQSLIFGALQAKPFKWVALSVICPSCCSTSLAVSLMPKLVLFVDAVLTSRPRVAGALVSKILIYGQVLSTARAYLRWFVVSRGRAITRSKSCCSPVRSNPFFNAAVASIKTHQATVARFLFQKC